MVGDTVHVSCRRGYTPAVTPRSHPPSRDVSITSSDDDAMTSLTVTCLDNLTWSTPQQVCRRVSCSSPRSSRDLVIMAHRSRFYLGDKLVYMCRRSLVPVSDPVLTCTSTGHWDKQPRCQAICKFPCQHGGVCVAPNRCKCPSGYGGRFCEKASCVLPCLNGGQCSGPYRCRCPHGFTGPRCEQPVCARRCVNGGRCIAPNRCLCPRGFAPPFCQHARRQGGVH